MKTTIIWLLLVATIICTVNGRWKRTKKNNIHRAKSMVLNTRSIARHPVKKSTLKTVEKPKISFFLVHNCTLEDPNCRKTVGKVDSSDGNSDKSADELLKKTSYKDIPKEMAEKIKVLMEERIKMLSNDSEAETRNKEKENEAEQEKEKEKEKEKDEDFRFSAEFLKGLYRIANEDDFQDVKVKSMHKEENKTAAEKEKEMEDDKAAEYVINEMGKVIANNSSVLCHLALNSTDGSNSMDPVCRNKTSDDDLKVSDEIEINRKILKEIKETEKAYEEKKKISQNRHFTGGWQTIGDEKNDILTESVNETGGDLKFKDYLNVPQSSDAEEKKADSDSKSAEYEEQYKNFDDAAINESNRTTDAKESKESNAYQERTVKCTATEENMKNETAPIKDSKKKKEQSSVKPVSMTTDDKYDLANETLQRFSTNASSSDSFSSLVSSSSSSDKTDGKNHTFAAYIEKQKYKHLNQNPNPLNRTTISEEKNDTENDAPIEGLRGHVMTLNLTTNDQTQSDGNGTSLFEMIDRKIFQHHLNPTPMNMTDTQQENTTAKTEQKKPKKFHPKPTPLHLPPNFTMNESKHKDIKFNLSAYKDKKKYQHLHKNPRPVNLTVADDKSEHDTNKKSSANMKWKKNEKSPTIQSNHNEMNTSTDNQLLHDNHTNTNGVLGDDKYQHLHQNPTPINMTATEEKKEQSNSTAYAPSLDDSNSTIIEENHAKDNKSTHKKYDHLHQNPSPLNLTTSGEKDELTESEKNTSSSFGNSKFKHLHPNANPVNMTSSDGDKSSLKKDNDTKLNETKDYSHLNLDESSPAAPIEVEEVLPKMENKPKKTEAKDFSHLNIDESNPAAAKEHEEVIPEMKKENKSSEHETKDYSHLNIDESNPTAAREGEEVIPKMKKENKSSENETKDYSHLNIDESNPTAAKEAEEATADKEKNATKNETKDYSHLNIDESKPSAALEDTSLTSGIEKSEDQSPSASSRSQETSSKGNSEKEDDGKSSSKLTNATNEIHPPPIPSSISHVIVNKEKNNFLKEDHKGDDINAEQKEDIKEAINKVKETMSVSLPKVKNIKEGENNELPLANGQNKKTATPKKKFHRRINEGKTEAPLVAETITKTEITSGLGSHGASLRGLLPLPPLEKLVDIKDKATKFKFLGCDIGVTAETCIMELDLRSKKCENVVSLPSLFDQLTRKGILRGVAGDFIYLDVFQVTKVNIERCKKEITFQTEAKEPFDFFSGVEGTKVYDGYMEMELNYENGYGFEQFGFKMLGKAHIADGLWEMSLLKTRGYGEGKFTINTNQMKVSDFYKVFTNGIELDKNTSADVKLFTEQVLELPKVKGVRDARGVDEIVVASPVNITEVGEGMIYIIVERKPLKPASVAVILYAKLIEPYDMLNTLVGVNLREVPLLNGVKVGVVTEYANNDIEKPVDSMLVNTLQKYITNSVITKGTRMKAIVPLKDVLKNKGIKIPKIRDVYLQIVLLDNVIQFRFPDEQLMDLSNILVALVPNVPEVLFKKIIISPPLVRITKFDVDMKLKNTSAVIEAPNRFPLGNNLIEVDSAKFDLKHTDGRPWEFSLKAKKKIGSSTVDISIKKDGDQFVLAGTVAEVSIRQIIDTFNVRTGVAEIVREASYLNFDVRDMKLTANFGQHTKILLHGTADFLKEKAYFEGILVEPNMKTSLTIGLVITDVSLEDLGLKMFPKDFKPLKGGGWMSKLTASIIASNSDAIKDLTFNHISLKENKIAELLESSSTMKQCYEPEQVETNVWYPWKHKNNGPEQAETRVWYPWKNMASCRSGISFGTKVAIPADCQGENICQLLQKNFGTDTEIYLKGVVTPSVMQLKSSIDGRIKMTDEMFIKDVGLIVSVGKHNHVSITGMVKLKLDNKEFEFQALVSYNPSGRLELILSMVGVYDRPLGLTYISLVGVNMNAGIEGGNLISSFDLSGKMLVGLPGNQLTADLSGGLDLSLVGAFYFYSKLSEATFKSITKAFGIGVSIPRAVSESTFQNDLIVGSTSIPSGKKLPNVNVALTSGLYFRGKINIFGFALESEIEVTFPGKLTLKAFMPKMILADGLIEVRNEDEKAANDETGPELYIVLDKAAAIVIITARVSLLDISASTKIEFTDKGLAMEVSGKYLDLIQTKVSITAPPGKLLKIPEGKYTAYSCLDSIISSVADEARSIINDGVKISEEASNDVKKQVQNAGAWYKKAVGKYETWKGKLKTMQENVEMRNYHYENVTKSLAQRCVDKCRENKTWVGGFDEKEYNFAGKKVKCPVWKEKKKSRFSPLCLIECEGNKVIEKSGAQRQKIGISFLRSEIKSQSRVLDTVQSFVDAARNVIEISEQASKRVSDAVSDGKKAVEYINKYTIDNIFTINKLCFGSSLRVAKEGCVSISVDLLFGGKNGKQFVFDTEPTCLTKNYATLIAEQIVYFGKFFPGLKSVKDKVNQVKNYFKKGEEEGKKLEGKFHDVQQVESDIDLKAKMAEGRTVADTEDELTEEINEIPDLPAFVIRNDHTMQAFRDMFFDEDDFTSSAADDNDENEEDASTDENIFAKADVPLDINELQKGTADKCKMMDTVINTYAEVGDGVSMLSDHNKREKLKCQAFINRILAETDQLRDAMNASCARANLTALETADALYYVSKAQDSAKEFENFLNHKFDILDKSSLSSWRNLMSDIVAEKGVEITSFLKILNSVSVEAARRHDVPNSKYQLGESLRYAEKIVNDLLLGEDDTLSSKRESIKDLQDQVMYMRQVKNDMDCH